VLLTAPGISVLRPTDLHAAALASTVAELAELRGNLMHDLHTAVLMREHGESRICTRDSDFHRFPFLSVVDPLRWAAVRSPSAPARWIRRSPLP
jgi:predicted nucleic acid-binding protein